MKNEPQGGLAQLIIEFVQSKKAFGGYLKHKMISKHYPNKNLNILSSQHVLDSPTDVAEMMGAAEAMTAARPICLRLPHLSDPIAYSLGHIRSLMHGAIVERGAVA